MEELQAYTIAIVAWHIHKRTIRAGADQALVLGDVLIRWAR